MSEVIVVTSGKGGVGKTTTVANIGTGLAALDKKVVLVDTDIGLRNLDVVLGLENRIVYNLVDVIEGNCRLKQALIKDKRYSGLYLLPSAQTRDKTSVTPEQMKKLCEELKNQFDYIILDCPAGIEQGFKNAIAGADKALVVTTPEVSAIRDADRIIGLLEAEELRDIHLIINRLRMDMIRRGDMMSVDGTIFMGFQILQLMEVLAELFLMVSAEKKIRLLFLRKTDRRFSLEKQRNIKLNFLFLIRLEKTAFVFRFKKKKFPWNLKKTAGL